MYLFSVIIPTNNRPKALLKAVKSVLSQKYQNFEVIVINDTSTENYTEIEKFLSSDNRISYFRVEYNNRSKTRNFGIDKAQGDWICFLDDDDVYLDNHLEVLNASIKKNNSKIGIYHTLTEIHTKTNISKQREIKEHNQHPINYYLFGNYFTMNNYCAHQSIFNKHPFPETLWVAEDKYQQITSMAEFPVYYSNNYTTVYNRNDNNTWNNGNYKSALAEFKAFKLLFNEKDVKRIVDEKLSNNKLKNLNYLLLAEHLNEMSVKVFYSCLLKYLLTSTDIKTSISFLKKRFK